MNAPSIVDANTAQVTNVQDNSDGNTSGTAGITGVVFYVGTAVGPNGQFQTLVATQTSPGTWRASVQASDLMKLHAVAVDGSGNFTDCAGNATSRGTAP